MNKELRSLILELSYNAKAGHIGSHLSIVDLIWGVYDSVLNVSPETVEENERDRFILSKGHAALALYVVLYKKGFVSREEIFSYGSNKGSIFAVHPKKAIAGVDFRTGSLGQGVTYAVGCALAAKIQKSKRKVYCLLSDGEINEGCVWESLMFAAHHKLNNLVFIYDNNKQQALGLTKDIIDLGNIEERVKGFGYEYFEIDGHDASALKNLYQKISSGIEGKKINKPSFINAHTICGKGVSYMEGTIEWHYKSMNDEQYKIALEEVMK